MKPSSAMAFASRMSGHSALACAFAGTGVVVAMVIAARAAERRRSRFVNMARLSFGMFFVLRGSNAGAEAPTFVNFYWADIPTVVCDFTTGGGFHLPVSASDFGAYRRIVRLKAPFGAGSQLASSSLPGLA